MILLADENIDLSVIARPRAEGHQVFAVSEMDPGVTDDVVLALANERNALLLTEDKDFGELVFRQGLVHAGVILIRTAGIAPDAKGQLLARTLASHAREVVGCFCVLTRDSLRIRKRVPGTDAG